MLLSSTDIHAWFFALLGVAMLPGVIRKSCGAKKFTHFIGWYRAVTCTIIAAAACQVSVRAAAACEEVELECVRGDCTWQCMPEHQVRSLLSCQPVTRVWQID